MKSITKCIAGMAGLALAAMPIAALSTAAHAESAPAYAQETVHVADLNLSAEAGKAQFEQRVDHIARRFCSDERNLELKAACQAGVHAEASEKAAASVMIASRN